MLELNTHPAGQKIKITTVELVTILHIQKERDRQRADVGTDKGNR